MTGLTCILLPTLLLAGPKAPPAHRAGHSSAGAIKRHATVKVESKARSSGPTPQQVRMAHFLASFEASEAGDAVDLPPVTTLENVVQYERQLIARQNRVLQMLAKAEASLAPPSAPSPSRPPQKPERTNRPSKPKTSTESHPASPNGMSRKLLMVDRLQALQQQRFAILQTNQAKITQAVAVVQAKLPTSTTTAPIASITKLLATISTLQVTATTLNQEIRQLMSAPSATTTPSGRPPATASR